MKFDEALNVKVNMAKVKLDALKPWIAKRVSQILGLEDDVVIEFIFNQLEESDARGPDPRKMQINLTGFLNGKNARLFMAELWKMLDSAQQNESGIPAELLEAKKEEIKNRQEEADRLQENLRRLAENNDFNKAEGDRGDRGDRGSGRSRFRRSPTPERRRRSRSRER
jgi:serine/arginine repetitive matrix protein 1